MSKDKNKNQTTQKIGRDSGTGQFKSVKDAQRDKQGSTVETIKRDKKK